ncbi:MAG: DUF2357 domain-containing protein [Firmicutes bacterium]|nr:DUF2357 domain-containing protein [Bacillota bacterium]
MNDKQIAEFYEAFKKRVFGTLSSDIFYASFLNSLQGGKRKFTTQNIFIDREVDETWVRAIELAIPHMSQIINNPRQFLKTEEDVVAVELARKITVKSIRHLSVNSHLIRNIEDKKVTPSKILTFHNEDTLDLYENRFVMTLLLKVTDFVEMRYLKLTSDARGKKSEIAFKGEFDRNNEKTKYSLQVKTEDGGYTAESGNANMKRIEKIREYLLGFKRTKFYKDLKGLPSIKMPVNKTNLLLKSPDYFACLGLWNFLDVYRKPGYSIKLYDNNTAPEGKIKEAECLVFFAYAMLKEVLAGKDAPNENDIERQRTVEPTIVRKSITDFVEHFDVGVPINELNHEDIMAGMLKAFHSGAPAEAEYTKLAPTVHWEEFSETEPPEKQDATTVKANDGFEVFE